MVKELVLDLVIFLYALKKQFYSRKQDHTIHT